MRARSISTPFALIHTHKNAQQIYCLNIEAEQQGLEKGMSLSDARAVCPNLLTSIANPEADARFLITLSRWAKRYCPWVSCEEDGLVLDVSGATHLFNIEGRDGEKHMLGDIHDRLNRAQLNVYTGIADTRGAAWALARYGQGQNNIAFPGKALAHIGSLPVAALRVAPNISTGLQRLGLRTIGDVVAQPRAVLSRRFGPNLLMHIDQALGDQPEPISPHLEPLRFAARLTLPEPIGLLDDVTGILVRLLERVCDKLNSHEKGARKLLLTIRRVDQESSQVEIALARPMRDAMRIASLFERSLNEIDAGFGIDQIHLVATEVEDLVLRQISRFDHQESKHDDDALSDLITRLGNRVGFDKITRLLPAESHIPERSFIIVPVSYSLAATKGWSATCPRPLLIFPPEILSVNGPHPPQNFRWRAMHFTTVKAVGPERIAPEWWLDDPNWRSGLRDYWRIQTRQGRRLWLFFTPQQPCWFVHGEFS